MELCNLKDSYLSEKYELRTIEDVLDLTPNSDEWSYCDGHLIHDRLTVTAILRDGTRRELERATHIGYADSYTSDYDTEADTVGVQLAGLEVEALILTQSVHDQNYDEDWEEYLPLAPIDWGKLRRRVEDALRKSSDRAILFEVAQKLNCKIY